MSRSSRYSVHAASRSRRSVRHPLSESSSFAVRSRISTSSWVYAWEPLVHLLRQDVPSTVDLVDAVVDPPSRLVHQSVQVGVEVGLQLAPPLSLQLDLLADVRPQDSQQQAHHPDDADSAPGHRQGDCCHLDHGGLTIPRAADRHAAAPVRSSGTGVPSSRRRETRREGWRSRSRGRHRAPGQRSPGTRPMTAGPCGCCSSRRARSGPPGRRSRRATSGSGGRGRRPAASSRSTGSRTRGPVFSTRPLRWPTA